MAKVNIKMPEDFLRKVSQLGAKTDEVIPRVLDAGAYVVLPKVKSNLQAVIGSGTKEKSRTTGELENALGVSPTKQDRDGNFNIKIGFDEPRKNGGNNAKIANILEYGKSGQPAKPFLKPATSATRKTCIETMKAKLQKEWESL